MPIQPVVIEEFKDASRPDSTWRLNWFGSIERDPDVATEYKVQVVLTKVKDDAKGAWHTEGAVEQDTLRMVSIGIGQLPLLRIGSLWKKGKLILLRSGVEQVFDLDIPKGVPSFYSATEIVGKSSLVPFRDHRLMGYGKNSKCIALPYNGDPAGIIIPVLELIRFYYANSTRLSKAVFDGDFSQLPLSIYDPKYTGLDGRIAAVCRRQDVSDNDCWTIARVLNSQDAFNGARRVNDSLIRDFTNTRQANPESAFPFCGPTRLKVLSKRVGYAPARWLVLSLVSCSAPFPYEELQVIADNDGRQAAPETDISDREKIPINRASHKPEGDDEPTFLQSGKEPDIPAFPKQLELAGDCFTALLGKNVLKKEKDHCDFKSGHLCPSLGAAPTTHGTGDGDAIKSGVGKIELTQPRTDALPPSYALLVDLINELNSRKNVSARFLPLSEGLGLARAIRTSALGRRQWAYLEHRTRRYRHIMMIEIQIMTRNFYLVEIERRNQSSSDKYCAEIFFDISFKKLTTNQIERIIETLSRQAGRINNPEPLTVFGLRMRPVGLKHTWTTVVEYANRVIDGASTFNFSPR